MKIKKLTILTNQLQEGKDFFTKTLGLKVYEENDDMFCIQIGWSKLEFKKSDIPFLYHYCFLIPSNRLPDALAWMENRVNILEIENGQRTVNFTEWNADSFYFYDGSGNLAEFIAHHDLENTSNKKFEITDILGINEIGIGTDDVSGVNSFLEETCQTEFWKGDLDRFGTNGSPKGRFLITNYNKKETWFPTQIRIKPSPFEVEIENNGKLYHLEFVDGTLKSNY